MEHVLLPVLDETRTLEVGKEMLEVEPGPGGSLLLHSPAFVDGLAGGDVIALDPALPCGFRIVARGGNLAVVVMFTSVELRASALTAIEEVASRLGGVCDGGPGRGHMQGKS